MHMILPVQKNELNYPQRCYSFFALGAIAASIIASQLISSFGPAAFFILIARGHVALVILGLNRMRVRPTAAKKHAMYMPGTPHSPLAVYWAAAESAATPCALTRMKMKMAPWPNQADL